MTGRFGARGRVAAAGLALALLAGGCSGGGGDGSGPSALGQAAPRTTVGGAATGAPSFTIAATGDLLIHGPVAARAREDAGAGGQQYDFRPMLAPVRGQLAAADLAICHLETPLSASNRNISGYPVFNTPRELAVAVRDTGYDTCSTASNHSWDQGLRGVRDTLDLLDRAGVGHSGTARNPAEAAWVEVRSVRGVRVGLLDYTYGLNSGSRLPEAPWAVSFIDPARILRDARAARQAGAAFVAVQLHWGEQYRVAPTAEQRSLARQLLASPDVDLVIGGHVHVVQPVERIGGKYVVYGVGNFLSNQSSRCCPPASQDGVIVTAHVERIPRGWAVNRITYTPTWVDIPSYRVLPVAASLDDPGTPAAVRPSLRDSWRRTVAAVTQLGPLAGNVRPDRAPR